jgi:putative protease
LATEKKVLVGVVKKFFSKLSVAEVAVQASDFNLGDKLLITGPTTGAMYLNADEIRFDLEKTDKAEKGQRVSIPVPGKVRPNDKLFKMVKTEVTE